ncbi:MAG: flagellar basal-body rod protein FlgG [Brevinemataceae bacterium]
MMRSLWTAATGMVGEQFHIDTISNNLANINTTGFKRTRAEFHDLLYQTQRLAGTPATEVTQYPLGIQTGLGVSVSGTQKFYTQGSLQQTGNVLDVAIQDEGFFAVQMPDGSTAYTRDGTFKIDSNREIVTSQGYKLLPNITLPDNFEIETFTVSPSGELTVRVGGNDEPLDIGRITLNRFINPAGLTNIGENLVKESPASGNAVEGIPSSQGFGSLNQRFLEMSNVSAITEMVDMIVAQRAYEFNSRAIQTSDNMLGSAVSLKR